MLCGFGFSPQEIFAAILAHGIYPCCRRFSFWMMYFIVLLNRQELEIFKTVVMFDTILMMNVFPTLQLSTNMLFKN
jgi:hypothetical protein